MSKNSVFGQLQMAGTQCRVTLGCRHFATTKYRVTLGCRHFTTTKCRATLGCRHFATSKCYVILGCRHFTTTKCSVRLVFSILQKPIVALQWSVVNTQVNSFPLNSLLINNNSQLRKSIALCNVIIHYTSTTKGQHKNCIQFVLQSTLLIHRKRVSL